MSKKDYYEVLGVSKTASDKDIKKNYRQLSKEYHPDKGGDEEKFKEINEAYSVLSDPEKRNNYDRHGHNIPNNHSYNGTDAFEAIRRMQEEFQRQHSPRHNKPTGQSIRLNVQLILEEIFSGVEKTFKYTRNITCKDCNGIGGHDEYKCSHCNGTGFMYEVYHTPMGMVQNASTCHHCSGQGKIFKSPCKTCNGSGVTPFKDEITFTIPSGVNSGDSMIISEKGHAIRNGDYGDLIVVVSEIKHGTFIRRASDLYYTMELSYYDIILGVNIEVSTIEGNKVKVDIPPYSNNETVLRLKGKGMTIHNSNLRGDMLIKVNVKLPTSISDNEKEMLNKIKEIN